jgi:hypothetical protein
MDHDFRERRAAQLRVMQADDPRRLIQKYCEITGDPATSQLPHGVSFSRMIDTILDREAAGEKSPVATK